MFTTEGTPNKFFKYLVAIPDSMIGWDFRVGRLHGRMWHCGDIHYQIDGTMWMKIEQPKTQGKRSTLAIVGSRDFNFHHIMEERANSFIQKFGPFHRIISGGADGADTLAKDYAMRNNFEFEEYPADWKQYGKRAGYLRNELLVSLSEAVLAFWDGESKGTAHTIEIAKKNGLLVGVVNYVTGEVTLERAKV